MRFTRFARLRATDPCALRRGRPRRPLACPPPHGSSEEAAWTAGS